MRRRFQSYTHADEDSTVDVTPMLDVVFILLIFFIVSASFVRESGIDVNKTEAASAEKKDTASIFVAINSNNEIWVDKKPVDISSLKANIMRLHSENPQGTLVIQADNQSNNQTLIQVMDAAKQAGVNNIALAADTK